ncbi:MULTISPECIES: hypothetical protein [Niastella]|uniref:Lipoprotein n=1 Tax=Niastella soli TaxID=2821487 RepID=A0ABS3YVN5_9BACT|nr:hypothetical protein [Niastella soli]MBO9201894.1 hypothetical protein [Niastella soli]
MKTTHFPVLLVLLAACNSQPKETEKETEKQAEAPAVAKADSAVSCYQYATAADTITLKLVRTGENVTGTLVYLLKEKDSNKGTIQGTLKGDLLVADYTFMAEGSQSIRQVAFKQTGNTFIEGYGDIVEENGKQHFKNVDSLDFSSTLKLQETACKP